MKKLMIIIALALALSMGCEKEPLIVDPVATEINIFEEQPFLEGAWMQTNSSKVAVWTFSTSHPQYVQKTEYDIRNYTKGVDSYTTRTVHTPINTKNVYFSNVTYLTISAGTYDITITFVAYGDENIIARKITSPLQTEPPRLIDYSVLEGTMYAGVDTSNIYSRFNTILPYIYYLYFNTEACPPTAGGYIYTYNVTRWCINRLLPEMKSPPGQYYSIVLDSCRAEISDDDYITKYLLHYVRYDSRSTLQLNYFPDEDTVYEFLLSRNDTIFDRCYYKIDSLPSSCVYSLD